jgi:hypothetical protein
MARVKRHSTASLFRVDETGLVLAALNNEQQARQH